MQYEIFQVPFMNLKRLPIPPGANVFVDQNCFSWIIDGVMQGCINTGRQVAVTTEFFTLALTICGSVVQNLPHVNLLAPRMLSRVLYTLIWKTCAPLV
jgi:hypothetical protein